MDFADVPTLSLQLGFGGDQAKSLSFAISYYVRVTVAALSSSGMVVLSSSRDMLPPSIFFSTLSSFMGWFGWVDDPEPGHQRIFGQTPSVIGPLQLDALTEFT